MCRKGKRKHITEFTKKYETKISMNKTILTIFKYGQWIKGITKSMLGERQHNESIIEINYPI